jgi:hypothetical protein
MGGFSVTKARILIIRNQETHFERAVLGGALAVAEMAGLETDISSTDDITQFKHNMRTYSGVVVSGFIRKEIIEILAGLNLPYVVFLGDRQSEQVDLGSPANASGTNLYDYFALGDAVASSEYIVCPSQRCLTLIRQLFGLSHDDNYFDLSACIGDIESREARPGDLSVFSPFDLAEGLRIAITSIARASGANVLFASISDGLLDASLLEAVARAHVNRRAVFLRAPAGSANANVVQEVLVASAKILLANYGVKRICEVWINPGSVETAAEAVVSATPQFVQFDLAKVAAFFQRMFMSADRPRFRGMEIGLLAELAAPRRTEEFWLPPRRSAPRFVVAPPEYRFTEPRVGQDDRPENLVPFRWRPSVASRLPLSRIGGEIMDYIEAQSDDIMDFVIERNL